MTDTTSSTVSEDVPSAPPARGRDRTGRVLLAVSVVLLVVALAAAAWFGTQWGRAALGGDGPAAQRDTALADARQAAINLTTINGDDVNGTLDSWNSVVTGELASQFASSKTELEQQITASKGSRTSTAIVNSALTTLDTDAGTATALIFANITTTTAQDEQPTEQRFALTMTVQRTDGGWKASALQSLAQDGTGQ